MYNSIHCRVVLGISITTLLIVGLYTFPLSQRTYAQLQSDKLYYKMMASDNNISNKWILPSSYVTISLGRNSSEAAGGNNNNNAVVTWNQLITAIGLQNKTPPPYFARNYALMHVAIYDALLQSTSKNNNNEKPSEVAVVAGAAAEVLAYLFPENFSSIAALEERQITYIQGYNTSQILDSSMIGHNVGKKVMAYSNTDASDALWDETLPLGPGNWTGTNPVGPLFGNQKTYILSSGAEFQPPPPYSFGSAKDLEDVQAVVDAAHARTPEQIAIIHKWADLPPPTIWNNMLNDRIGSHNLSIYESARASAYLNAAMYDSFVSCWYTKYTYWTARPYQRIFDPTFTTVIPTPNFPSYTSGHSTISSAAAVVLGQLFPEEAIYFLTQAHEAAVSRLWAGIHFPQDNDNGFAVGQQIGRKYVSDMLKSSHQFVIHAR